MRIKILYYEVYLPLHVLFDDFEWLLLQKLQKSFDVPNIWENLHCMKVLISVSLF